MSHRRVLAIAVPILLSNATVPLLGLVDTYAVGQMGSAAPIGAVALGAELLTAFYWLFGFLRMGVTGMAAQARGGGDDREVAALLVRGVGFGMAAGAALILLQMPLIALALRLAPGSAEVEGLARDYMVVRVWSAPATIALYAINGWLIAAERTRDLLIVQVITTGLNAVLSLWFVLGLQAGVSGVAWASFIAEWSGLLVGLWFCWAGVRAGIALPLARVFDKARWREMAVVNGDILVRSLLLQLIFLSFMFYGAGLGDVPLAANQVLLQFLMVTAFALDGFAFALETLVGQSIGARDRAQLRRAVVLGSGWSLAIAALLTLAFWSIGAMAIDKMTTAEAVRAAARDVLPYMIAAPLIGLPSWLLDGIFIGATQTREMRNMMLISAIVYGICLVPLVHLLENHGLWLALLISFVVRAATLAAVYPRVERRAI